MNSPSQLQRSRSERMHKPKSCLKDPTNLHRKASPEFQLKKVLFADVEVREYPQILGDNPAVSEGVPLTLLWNYDNCLNMNLDVYECIRKPLRREGRKQFALSPLQRFHILVEAGYSIRAIGARIVEMDEVRALRFESASDAYWNDPKDGLSERFHKSGAAIIKVSKKGSRILFGPITAAMHGLKIKHPKPKSITNPAC